MDILIREVIITGYAIKPAQHLRLRANDNVEDFGFETLVDVLITKNTNCETFILIWTTSLEFQVPRLTNRLPGFL